MSMYRREHAGFDYELWLRRGHTGTPDDFLEWLRGPKGDPADADSIEVDNLTPEARARLEGAYLGVANERPFGSIEIPNTHSLQGFCSFSGNGSEYVVFAYAKGLPQTTAAQYAAAEIPANHETHLARYNLTQDRVDTIVVPTKDSPGDRGGHYNDMTYCPDNGRIYVANYSLPRIEIFNTALEWLDSIDLSGYGVDHAGIHLDNDITKQRKYQPGCPNGIAWSEKEKCFYVNFRDISAAGGTAGMFRFNADFSKSEQIDFVSGSYSRQGLYVERDTGNIMSVKFRRDRSFRYPPGNRIHIHDRTGRLIAITYVDCERELEGICELSDGHYLFGFYAKGGTKHAAMFTRGVLSSNGGTSLYSRWSKAYLNTSDYNNNTNNIYYAETGHTIAVGDGIAETGAKAIPYRTWASLLNFLKSNTTETLKIHLLTDLLWPLNISFYDRNISFIGEAPSTPEDDEESGEGDETTPDDPDEGESDGSALRSIPQVSLYRCQSNIRFDTLNVGFDTLNNVPGSLVLVRNRSVFFYGCTVSAADGVAWNDNDLLSFEECDLTGVADVDLLRTRLVLLKNITAYGTATRFHGVGTSYRIYGNTTADEQYALRGQPSATPNIVCSELTRISQIRMGMNMSVSTVTAGKMTDIPFWLRNGDWDNGTATCSTAGNVSEKAITVAGISALTDGLEFLITFTHANTVEGDLSLNLNGLGAVPLLFDDWTDGEQVCVKYYAPNPTVGTAARFVRYGLPFTGRAEVLSNDAMLYVITHGGEEYRRIVEFDGTTITADSGWQTRDDEIYPINTVVRPEAMADNWAGRRVVVFGDSITNWSHGGYWTNYLVSEAGCAVTNRSVNGAGFARGVNTIIGQLGTKATVTEAGLAATALYGGLWGNGLTYTIAEAGDTFTVTVSLDGQTVLTYTGLATIGDLKTASSGNGYLTFDGTDATALVAGESIALDGAELVESGLFDGAATVIVAAGTNDANSAISGGDIRAAIEGVITAIRTATAAPIIFITPIRRSHDSSGGAGTETYSRQRLVGAAICNVAVLNDCSVVNGYDFPIATTGTEWVTDMTLDGLHPEAAGKDVYAHSFLTAVGYSPKATIKILGIGNSHTRDALYYLYEILAHAGYCATVGHYYWGNSSLKEQYDALMDGTGESWPTDGKDYYRKYDKDGTLSNHRHADDHVHKLDYALTDEDWDVVVFQNATPECAHSTGFYAPDFNIDTFVDEVKQRVGNPDLRVGLMAPHTRSSDYAGDTIDGDLYTPDMLDGAIQATIMAVAADMKHCDFIVNSGLAIRYARKDENLDALGHDMTRIDLTNTEPPVNSFDKIHLEFGVPMFIASMTYAMAVCGDEVGCISWTPGAPTFDARKIYGKNDVLEYNGTLYRKNVTTVAEAWDDSHWDEHDNAYLAYLGKLCARRAVFPRLEGSPAYYATCDTVAATAAKEATTAKGDFVLTAGAQITVKFEYANTADAATLNVDGTGAKPIKNTEHADAKIPWRGGEFVSFVYDGANYCVVGSDTAGAVRSSGLYIQGSDTHGYSSADDFPINRIVEVASGITATKITNLPVYGEIAYVLTLAYNATTQYCLQMYVGTSTMATRIRTSSGWGAWSVKANA